MNPGDVVYLKSGGPAMTVRRVQGDIVAEVLWFSDEDTLCTADFPLVCLSTSLNHNWTTAQP
jgi:uncharacterized protein YodC (DUF2158 family)